MAKARPASIAVSSPDPAPVASVAAGVEGLRSMRREMQEGIQAAEHRIAGLRDQVSQQASRLVEMRRSADEMGAALAALGHPNG